MTRLTNAQLAHQIAATGSVVYNGTTYTRTDDLPSDRQMALDAGETAGAPTGAAARLSSYSTAGVSVGDVATAFPDDWTTGSTNDPLLVVAFPPDNQDYDTAAFFGSNVETSTQLGVHGVTGAGTGVQGTARGVGGTGVRGLAVDAGVGIYAGSHHPDAVSLLAEAYSGGVVALKLIGVMQMVEQAAPASPPAGSQYLYIDSTTHHLCRKMSNGTVVDLG